MKRSKKIIYSIAASVLLIALLLPFLFLPATCGENEEVELYREDFSRFLRFENNSPLTAEDGFTSGSIPSTTVTQKKDGNVWLKIDFVSGNDPQKKVWFLPSDYTRVEEGTEGAVCADEASYGLISGSDPNLDKNLQLNTPLLSYEQHPKVILEARYYFEKGADGSIFSQIRTYTSKGSENRFLYLFDIDPTTGWLNTAGISVSSNQTLKHGEWNTVSVVIDMVSGKADYYLNYALHSKDAKLGEQLVFNEGSFIAAKIHRTRDLSHIAAEELSGSFCVDDVRVYTPGDSTFVTVPAENAEGAVLTRVSLKKNGETYHSFTGVFHFLCTDGFTVEPIYFSFDLSSYAGVVKSLASQVRLENPGGLRFVSALDLDIYRALCEQVELGNFADVSFGTLIAPVSYIEEAGAFSVEALSFLGHRVNYMDVPAVYGEWCTHATVEEAPDDVAEANELVTEPEESDGTTAADANTSDAGDTTGTTDTTDTTTEAEPLPEEKWGVFSGAIVNIDPSHFDDAFAGIGYVRVTHVSGAVKYIYGDWDGTGLVMAEEAEKLLESDAPLHDSARAFLETQCLQRISDIPGGPVSDMAYTDGQFFFRYGENIACRITYAGDGAWRLKAQPISSLGFTGEGAAQALRTYLGEAPDETALPFDIRATSSGYLRFEAEDGTAISLGVGRIFSLRVFNAKGNEVSRITKLETDGENITLRGMLTENEAIFGGGEKFDSINRRGMLTRLYSTDGWNRSETTYMVVPLFFTSRGGGFFFNRYEDMMADFGATKSDEWALYLKNDTMDCYLYATEEGKEVISHYTKLSGNADVPEEWAYGVMICRYSSDLRTFDRDLGGTNKDGAPSGRSVKTMVNALMDAGMKPSAMVMEAWNYQALSANTELAETVKWLHSLDIKAMVYMRVGSSVSSSMSGYKDEYFVHAHITENGSTSYTMQIPDVTSGGVSGNPDVSKNRHIYLDITNPEAVDWYCNTVWGQLIEMGVDGVKIDFCETMPDEGYDYGGLMVEYDWYDPTVIPAGGEHHFYPTAFITMFYRNMNELKLATGDADGFYLLSRGGGIGSQCNPFLWAGDQVRSFTKLDDQLKAVVTSGLSGVPFMTYDMAGYRYGGDGTTYGDVNSLAYESAVFARAIEFTAFTVNIQTHGTVRNVYELEEDTQEIYRLYTAMHDELSDYITKNVLIACETGIPAVRHPVLEYQTDPNVYNINDQFLLGDGLMVAPILSDNTYQRTVYLPRGEWTNLLTGEVIEGGKTVTVSATLGQIPIFLNNESEDADALREVFAGETWTAIMNWR